MTSALDCVPKLIKQAQSRDHSNLDASTLGLTRISGPSCILRSMSNCKSILVFGATGSCGRAVVDRGLHRGLRITAYVRNEAKARSLFDTSAPNLNVVAGELTDRELIRSLLADHDAVLSCLSSFESPHDRMSGLATLIADYAREFSDRQIRLVVYGLCGVEDSGDWISHAIQGVLGVFSPGKYGPAIQDHKRVAEILAASSVDYTLFQTATMVDKPIGAAYKSGSPEDCPGVRLWDRWGVLDAADACLDSIDSTGIRRLQMRYLS